MFHKPIGVICSTVDPKITNVVIKETDPKFGMKMGGKARRTVYDVAAKAGFPTNLGLVGRLDVETSGIMMFSNDPYLTTAIRDPVDETSPLFGSEFKSKEYLLQLHTAVKHLSVDEFDTAVIEADLSRPLTFTRFGVVRSTGEARIRVERIWRNAALSFGRPDLGWVIDVRVTLGEGKNQQIRRLARRSKYKVLSLTRLSIASILDLQSVPKPGDCRWLTENELRTLREGFNLEHREGIIPPWLKQEDGGCMMDDCSVECEEENGQYGTSKLVSDCGTGPPSGPVSAASSD